MSAPKHTRDKGCEEFQEGALLSGARGTGREVASEEGARGRLGKLRQAFSVGK